jgi:PAS domain S-box-containing protein
MPMRAGQCGGAADLAKSAEPSRIQRQADEINRLLEELRRQVSKARASMGQLGTTLPASLNEALVAIQDQVERLRQSVSESAMEMRNLEALVDIGNVINSSLDLEIVLNEVMDTIIQLSGAERAFLMVRNEKGDMEVMVARNWERESLEPQEWEISSTIVGRVLENGEAILTTNALADPRFGAQESIIAYNLRSILCVPLKVKGKLTGVVYADNRVREGLFTERERSLLSAFANQAAVAIENAMLFGSVQRSLAEVTELKTLMEDVFASIGSGILTTDIDDVITLCNRAAEEILGLSRERLLGASLVETLGGISPDLVRRVREVKQHDRRYLGLEIQAPLDERGMVDLSLSITPLKSVDQSTRGVAVVMDDLTEKHRLEAQRRLFERMVSPAVIDQLDPDSLQLGGHRTLLTTLFADIRGFAAFSESTDPETLVQVLNRYLAVAAEAILAEEGTIDKFLGDEVMAWFNAPVPQPDHALRAVRAALAMQRAVAELHRQMIPAFRLPLGIGIHSGEALLGLIGTQRRLEYTAIGDSVNIAKRLQENAGPGEILVSLEVAQQISKAVRLVPVAPVRAKGLAAPIKAFRVEGLSREAA